jgi:hypothetical protein
MVLVHAMVFAPLVYALREKMPPVERTFQDYNIKLPALSQWAFAASHWTADRGPENLVVVAGLLVTDAAFLWFLIRENRALGWAYFLVILLLALVLALAAEAALALAREKLRQAGFPL